MNGTANHQDAYDRAARASGTPLIGLGAVLAVIGLGYFVMLARGDHADQAWHLFHLNFLFFTGLSAGAVIFSATQKITKGKWSGPIVRFAEAGVAFLPIALVLYLALWIGKDHVFPWIANPTPKRGAWLTTGFVFWRDLVSLLVVMGIAIRFVMLELRPDILPLRDGATGLRRMKYDFILGKYTGTPEDVARLDAKIHWYAPVLVVAYAYLFSLMAFDLMMSLAPYWISNLFGAYYFMSSFLAGLTLLGLMMVYWRKRLGLEELIGRQQFHDLGKLIFGFTVFWAYLTYSQIIVIWYGNLPEETAFLFYRMFGEWRPVTVLVALMVFLIPFWGLIWVKSKTTPLTFALFATISFAGTWLQKYVEVTPSYGPPTGFGLAEVVVSLGFLGLFLLAYGWFASMFPMVSPRLAEKTKELHH